MNLAPRVARLVQWVLFSFSLLFSVAAMAGPGTHGLAMHGDLKYPPGLDHFAYVNPNAPKGGTIRLASLGTFDSLNPVILKGSPADGLNVMGQGLIYESLMVQSDDEPFSMYGLVAERVELARDRSHVTFYLNPRARWHDGQPISADDVAWTFETLIKDGAPFFRAYFADVGKVTVIDQRTIRFAIKNPDNRELPLIIAQLAVLPKHYWTEGTHDITQTTLTPPLGSGPYKIGTVKPGTSIEYVRADDWWARDLPVNRGRYNFDRITFDYYRDHNVALEAFFAGHYDVRLENVAKLWATSYDAPPLRDGRVMRAEIPHINPAGMQAFVYNTRRAVFSNPAVRQALAFAFDYEWSNKKLADSAYTRTDSFFENSELAATGLPTGRELEILSEYRGRVPDAVFTEPYVVPQTDGSGNNRANLKRAVAILEEAGFKLGDDGVRVGPGNVRLEFEFLESNPALERWINPFIANLKKIGVEARLRVVDPAQYQNRIQDFDFDMTSTVIGQSDSPGNEQRDLWMSTKADIKGSRNIIGIKDPVIDDLVERVIAAPTRAELVARTRALDRVLLHSYYVIPNWHYAKWRVAWWRGFHRPDAGNVKSLGVIDDWWYTKP